MTLHIYSLAKNTDNPDVTKSEMLHPHSPTFPVPNPEPTHLIAISDLHLSATQKVIGDAPKITEGYFYDDAFAQFTQHLTDRAQGTGGVWRLLILGDGLDFLHTRSAQNPNSLSPASSLDESRIKLDLIFDAHPQFFASLGQLLANGFHVDIVPGNHDIELIRLHTQAHFKSLMKRHTSVNAIAERLTFFNWLYHVPGILYAEHGNQHHAINSFATLLVPIANQHTDEIDHPLGAYLDLYLFHLSEHVAPPKESTRNLLGHILRELLKHPLDFISQSPAHIYFLWHVTTFLLYRISPWMEIKRRKYRQLNFPAYAKHVQLNQQVLDILDNIAAIPSTRLLGRVLSKLMPQKATNENYLQRSAQKIHASLKKQRQEALFYLFGHSHIPAKLPLDERSYYLNDGSWISEESPISPGNKRTFPYIYIHWGGQAVPNAELMSWQTDI